MSRLLVATSLAILAFWVVASIVFVVQLLVPTPALNPVLTVAGWVFFAGIPLAVAAVLVAGFVGRQSSSASQAPMSWDGWRQPKVVVALTAYDDEESIPLAVREFKAQPQIVEVIVVDNNSVDRTSSVASSEGARVVLESKQGYGYACIRGLRECLRHSDANVIALAEGDMTFHASDINKMIPYLEDVDMVLGTRTTYELTSPSSQMDWFMSWGNLFLAALVRLRYWDSRFLGKIRLTDVGCTFRVMRREALESLIDDLWVGGDHFSPHMIVTALQHHMRIIEVPIKFRKRVGKSKGAGSGSRTHAIRVGLQMLREIITGG